MVPAADDTGRWYCGEVGGTGAGGGGGDVSSVGKGELAPTIGAKRVEHRGCCVLWAVVGVGTSEVGVGPGNTEWGYCYCCS